MNAKTAASDDRSIRSEGSPTPESGSFLGVSSNVVGVSPEERVAIGKKARAAVALESHADFDPRANGRRPVDLLEEQAKSRVPKLVPIRHGRMLVSPFTYFRGAALPMAWDLSATPISGLTVQLCGDAHLSNFGVFGSPERHLFFDVNDFDETAPGPWEWDVKRLAASFEVAGREHDFPKGGRKAVVRGTVRAYREAMRDFAGMPMLNVWYANLNMDELLPKFRSLLDPEKTPSVWHTISKARAHDSMQAFEKLCHVLEGEPRIASDPPLLTPLEELAPDVDPQRIAQAVHGMMASYQSTLQLDRRHLLEQYRVIHLARKVVGVGSVGTEAWVVLLLDRGHSSPLLLQIKEAEASVLERFTLKSDLSNHGHRVVDGQRIMQTASDIFLGWGRFAWDGNSRDYYIRQLRDWKGSADIQGMTLAGMKLWGQLCGWTLARAHARSGDRIAIASYLGNSDRFDRAIREFSVAYANQVERDHEALIEAVADGRLAAVSDT